VKLYKLGQICKLVGGGTPSKSNAGFYNGDIPWATVRDLRTRWLENTEHKINLSAVGQSSTNVIPAGNVVLASRVGLGKVVQLKCDTAINQDLRALVPRENSNIDSDYLYYWTLSISPQIISAGKGATVQGVTLPFLENLEIPVPSIDKQREVVEKLDKAFAEIDLLEKNNLDAISLNEILLSTKINSEFRAILNTQSSKTLGEYGKLGYGFTAKSSHSHNGPKYLRITDIQNKTVNWDDVPNCVISSEEKSKFKLKKGDIVFARTGATTGKSYLINDEVDAVFASYLIRIEPNIDILVPEFLFYFFQSSYYWDVITEGITGSAQGGFNASKLQAMRVNFPNEKKSQEEIVARIREFEAELYLRASKLLDQSSRIAELRISLLSQAFAQEEVVS
jgi:type I restriction enzyme S subunit